MKLPPSIDEARRIRRRLLGFYDAHRRDLPWRETRDPYRILVSEVMLQQTTVTTVLPYYRRFIRRFPDLPSLAAAPEGEVLAQWSGLGYYGRARNLQRACQAVADRHGGELPDTYDGLLALPGVGPYTAGAVSSIAFARAEPVLDGNVRRVLSRLGRSPGRGAAEDARLLASARRLLDRRRPGDLNQALMELGATVCTPRRPSCAVCPVAGDCRAAAAGDPERWPAPQKRPATSTSRGVVVVIRRRGGVLVVRRPDRPPLAGLWELPGISGVGDTGADPTPERAAAAAGAQLGGRVELRERLGEVRHGVMRTRVRLEVRRGVLRRGTPRVSGEPVDESGLLAERPRWCVKALDAPDLPPLTAAGRKALGLPGVLDGRSRG